MQKVLITGARGLLGSELACFKSDGFETAGLSREECDVSNAENVRRALELHRPDVIINCAVVVSVEKCEADEEKCFGVNCGGVKNLLEGIRGLCLRPSFVQVSSSEVFGRVREGEYKVDGYTEDDEPRPASAYQRSKAEAEKILQNFACESPCALRRWFIARAGWLYGAGRKTFIELFLEKLQKEEPLEVIANQWRSPTWARYFARGLFDLLSNDRESGIYHITNEVHKGEASTLDVVEELALHLGLGRVKAPLKLVSREDIFKIPRAPSNVIKNTKLPKLPYWRRALREYINTTAGHCPPMSSM